MPPAKRKPDDTEPDETTDEVTPDADESQDAPEPEPASTAEPLTLSDHLARASAPRAGLSGWTRICDALEVGFVHALAGAKDEARELLADADTEFAKFAPNLKHLEAQFSLLYARVLAALGEK